MANALGGVLLAGMAPIFMLGLIGLLLSVQIFAFQPIMLTSQFDSHNQALHSQATIVSADANGAFAAGYSNLTGHVGRYFVDHFDKTGRIQWNHLFGVEGDSVQSITAGGMGVYVVGVMNDSWVLAQFDSNGNQIWTRPLDTANGYVASLNGNAYVAGNESMTVFNSIGTNLSTSHGLKLTGIAVGASADSTGVYVLTSSVLAKLSLSGSELWTASPVSCSAFGTTEAKPTLALASGMEFVDYSGCLIFYDSNGRMIRNMPVTCVDQSSYWQESWISADSAGFYAIMSDYNGSNCLTRYDNSGNQVSAFYLPMDWRINSISTRNGVTYVAGAAVSTLTSTVLVARLGFSNDLILFGIHSPLSYLFVVIVVGLVCLGVFRYSRRHKRNLKKALAKEYRFDGPVD